MSNQAENIVKRGTIPSEWSDGADEVSALSVNAFETLESVRDVMVPAVRFARDDNNEVIMDEDGTPAQTILMNEVDEPVMEQHPLAHRAEHHGLHAYRYETCDDGSVVALYSNDPSGEVKMVAFPDIETASSWSPRLERG